MLDTASLTLALGSAKNIIDLLKNANDAHLAMKVSVEVANLQSQLLAAQQKSLEMQQDSQNIRAELESLNTFRHHHSAMWRVLPDETEDGPFCPTCHAEGTHMRLQLVQEATTAREYLVLFCPKTHVQRMPNAPVNQVAIRQEPTYKVPKNLLPKDYFYIPPKPTT